MEHQSSDSLDTMLGLSTEKWRETAVTPSSFLGTHTLTDPTLASSDSNQPPTPHQEGRGRPQDGGPSGHTAVRGQQHPAQIMGASPGSVPSRGNALGPGRPPAGAPTPPVDTLQVFQHMQHLQMQQMKDMQQQNINAAAAAAWARA